MSSRAFAGATARQSASATNVARRIACTRLERRRTRRARPASSQAAAVARAQVLRPAVAHRDHRAGARPFRERAASSGASTNGMSHASTTTGPDGARARRRPRAARRAGPAPAGCSRTARSECHARADFEHRIADLGEHARGPRRERLAAPHDRRLVGSHPPARPPVRSSAGTRDRVTSRGADRVADDHPARRARFSSSTRFCTLPSSVRDPRRDDGGLPRRDDVVDRDLGAEPRVSSPARTPPASRRRTASRRRPSRSSPPERS